MIAIGTNTDPYQPIEEDYGVTRDTLKVLSAFNHPVGIVTKGARVTRDLNLLVDVGEPRASMPQRLLEAI